MFTLLLSSIRWSKMLLIITICPLFFRLPHLSKTARWHISFSQYVGKLQWFHQTGNIKKEFFSPPYLFIKIFSRIDVNGKHLSDWLH